MNGNDASPENILLHDVPSKRQIRRIMVKHDGIVRRRPNAIRPFAARRLAPILIVLTVVLSVATVEHAFAQWLPRSNPSATASSDSGQWAPTRSGRSSGWRPSAGVSTDERAVQHQVAQQNPVKNTSLYTVTVPAEHTRFVAEPAAHTEYLPEPVIAQPYPEFQTGCVEPGCEYPAEQRYVRQWLPDGLIYKSYLAGPKESRFGIAWLHERDAGWVWDISLGGRAGILRYGTPDAVNPRGWQLDIEGAAFPRLENEHEDEMMSTDYRFGVPMTWTSGRFDIKLAYYHISAHLGDEYLLRNPGVQRFNYVRDSFVLGAAYHATPNVRIYAEAAWGFKADVAEPWEFQFGYEYNPQIPLFDCGRCGTPFFAMNRQSFEEYDFEGNVNVMAGWQWRSGTSGRQLRLGLQYFYGKSSQYAFFNRDERLIGLGLWFDF